LENYFNYFTEIEEQFRRCRGTPTLLSPLDWALIESWKEAGIPLAAVLTGIERSFQKFAKRPHRFRNINGLAYCSQLVMQAAEEFSAARVEGSQRSERAAQAPFTGEETGDYLKRNAEALERTSKHCLQNGQQVLAEDLNDCATALREISWCQRLFADLEELERRLSALEEKLTASLTRSASVDLLAEIRHEVDRALVPYRSKMTATQIESLERQFLKKSLFEHYQIPRLSLFFL